MSLADFHVEEDEEGGVTLSLPLPLESPYGPFTCEIVGSPEHPPDALAVGKLEALIRFAKANFDVVGKLAVAECEAYVRHGNPAFLVPSVLTPQILMEGARERSLLVHMGFSADTYWSGEDDQ